MPTFYVAVPTILRKRDLTMRLAPNSLRLLAAATLLATGGCDDSGTALEEFPAELVGTWATNLQPLGHQGYSHLILSENGSAATDQAFVVAGSSCTLDQEHAGGYVVNSTTLALFWKSGVIEVRGCTGATASANHAKRAMSSAELAAANNVGHFTWTVSNGVLTLDNGSGVVRTYTRL
jgi:hypothetical protein